MHSPLYHDGPDSFYESLAIMGKEFEDYVIWRYVRDDSFLSMEDFIAT